LRTGAARAGSDAPATGGALTGAGAGAVVGVSSTRTLLSRSGMILYSKGA
jgi:hypothetical protein